ncbi:lipopolysaccharide transport periplasmic protein LptA [Pseudoxanthomonas mexicana]|uniref:lipopolysaccharide transport periplasmic protein LptA n=1 Tax=Pseudoxanthomonas mexicana TaxID=128785 RepID=UPI00398B03FC
MNRANASILALALLLASPLALAKSTDRNQPMDIESDSQSGVVTGDGTTVLSGNVVLTQGTLSINAARGEIIRSNGELSKAIFTGKQVKMRQQLDDGSWMDAAADRIEYDLLKETVVFIGNYTISSPRGSNSGQRMVYNTTTGGMQSGGDGSRVRTVIQPKSAAPQGKN